MPNYYASSTLLALTGASRDNMSNMFAVASTVGLDSTVATVWKDAIAAFYNACNSAGTLAGRAQNGHSIKFLAADGSVPNYPIFTRTFNLSAAAPAVDLPLEVNLCCSYANDTEVGVSVRRRRGRIYIGGHLESWNTAGRPATGIVSALATAYQAYANTINATATLTAGVWSRRDATVYAIERVWCDNEWDTMRSRGGRSTARETRSVTP